MLKKYYITPDSSERLDYLPKTYNGVSPLTETNCVRFGWQIETVTIDDPINGLSQDLIQRAENAKKEIVKQIINLALKYNATETLFSTNLTIPNLENLAKQFNVSNEDWNLVLANIFLYRCELEAISSQSWADLWQELKASFTTLASEIINDINGVGIDIDKNEAVNLNENESEEE